MTMTSHGRSTRRFRQLKAQLRGQRRPCSICGQPIDYALKWPHPNSFSADHRLPLSTHPELAEDFGNLQPAHLRCNQGKSDNAQFAANLGLLSEEF
ncbi:HNH endonuclease [Microbacterium sp. 179-B 1A2 NHS]|uniref:HNH endonuclease n=1 Tax=Microbacterium sp. 179-B 1A2 NHS TaxID=3142383 RepID=UPI0039A1E9A2